MREKLRHIRRSIPASVKENYARQLAENFRHTLNDFQHLNIASYQASSEEISPKFIDHFLKQQQNTLYYPILHPFKKRHLWFGKDLGIWMKNKYQLLEPKLSLENIIAPWLLDAVIVPLVGFDRNRNRMGMGSGYYDMSFAFRKQLETPQLIGIAFDEQQRTSIAVNDWDIPMDIIITPSQIFRKQCAPKNEY